MEDKSGVTKYAVYARFILEAFIIVGSFAVILTNQTQVDTAAAFGLLGVIAASIVRNIEPRT